MKHYVLAGVTDDDRAELIRHLAKAGRALAEPWAPHDGASRVDLVILDLEHFAGRVARVRAMNERTDFAVIVDAEAQAPDAPLVLRRPLSPEALIDLLNRAVGGGDTQNSDQVTSGKAAATNPAQVDIADEDEADAIPARACFETPRRERPCTDFASLVQRGPVLIERAGLPRLMLDPGSDNFHANAPLSRLEPYFLDPIKGNECRQVVRSRLDELRSHAPGRPLVQLHWMGALLRSNGCLGAHLDPGGTFRVQRWMSVYGEYRKQYRIATMMMRPLRLHEIARKADATMVEVFDVVNAYDAIGLLEWQPRASRHAAVAANDAAERPRAQGTRRLLAAALLTR
ncbi:MAG: hypothetical protein ACREPX_14505 [Rhodanobacteraceae bacterium]